MAALEPPVRRRRARSLRDEAYRPGANSPAPPPLQGSAVAAWLRGGGERRELGPCVWDRVGRLDGFLWRVPFAGMGRQERHDVIGGEE